MNIDYVKKSTTKHEECGNVTFPWPDPTMQLCSSHQQRLFSGPCWFQRSWYICFKRRSHFHCAFKVSPSASVKKKAQSLHFDFGQSPLSFLNFAGVATARSYYMLCSLFLSLSVPIPLFSYNSNYPSPTSYLSMKCSHWELEEQSLSKWGFISEKQLRKHSSRQSASTANKLQQTCFEKLQFFSINVLPTGRTLMQAQVETVKLCRSRVNQLDFLDSSPRARSIS